MTVLNAYHSWPMGSACRLWPINMRFVIILTLVACLASACTRFLPIEIKPDIAADRVVAQLTQVNAGLIRFKCVGQMKLSGPNRPLQSFRTAMAGMLPDRLRIDMLAPFGGVAGTVASDGSNLVLVMHSAGEYHKKRFGNGSLRRMIQIDVSVGDLLDLLVGRIPIDTDLSARLVAADGDFPPLLVFLDHWGRIRQRIQLDAHMQPVHAEWLDSSQQTAYSLTVGGSQVVEGFTLPERIEIVGAGGERVSLALERYEANARLDENLFAPPRPLS